jgi:ABC-type branched-subunit amino acid transport system substrate-binding protein
MSKSLARVVAVTMALMLVAAACSSDDDGGDDAGGGNGGNGGDSAQDIDYEAIGLWDDGPCDDALEPLRLGLMTVFESPVLSLEDQALALEASAEAFNARGGANGACIEVTTCDDGGNIDQAVGCAREVDDAGVVATVNDQGTAGQADVSAAMAAAGIPRVASNVVSEDWDDPNAYPLDASGTGVVFLLPQALIEEGVTEIGLIRVDLAAASALAGLLEDAYAGDATFPVDVPVPAGTTDFSQFILAAEGGGAGGVTLAIGEQEAIQVVRAGEQLGTDLLMGSSLGSFSQSTVADLGDFAEQMVFLWSFYPATYELPVYEALRGDLAASGEESLQPENLKASPMRSWIGLYALLWMIRDTGMTDFTGEAITTMLNEAVDVPMLDMFGGENWTPSDDHPGIFKRAGTSHWSIWRWDPDAASPTDVDGNFAESAEISFDEVLCGTIFGAPEPC